MKLITILYLFLGYCYVKNGYAKSNTECAAYMTAFPPAIKTGCCSDDLSGSKLIAGQRTAINQYPWIALIEYTKREKRETLCGGSLISGRYVLTSAHCVTGRVLSNWKPLNVLLGEYNKTHEGPDCVSGPDVDDDCTEGEIRIPLDKVIPHPDYNQSRLSRLNDIALIRMKKIAPYTDFIRPICLPTEDVTLKTGPLNFVFAGWGTSYGPSDVKLHLDLPFVAKDKCQTVYSNLVPNLKLGKEQLCAGGIKGKDSCLADGGMPLMYESGGKYEIVGIASFGLVSCGTENNPSVYTYVFQYSSWISSNITP